MKWDTTERRINCLAHVINLATQKLISTYSKASYFNIHDSNAHIPDTSLSHDGIRDEIGLLRAIAVKERSSAKRKELFRGIQIRDKTDPDGAARQMIPDMKVRWSSTYAMLDHQLQETATRPKHLAPKVKIYYEHLQTPRFCSPQGPFVELSRGSSVITTQTTVIYLPVPPAFLASRLEPGLPWYRLEQWCLLYVTLPDSCPVSAQAS
ncbi:hypothetical protein B0H14DRAFT_3148272 [Mycena olivaceomarginata]|nr:hypothetical protein B0H14DRAFT_3148272 [Mycena olivaceomarginata]